MLRRFVIAELIGDGWNSHTWCSDGAFVVESFSSKQCGSTVDTSCAWHFQASHLWDVSYCISSSASLLLLSFSDPRDSSPLCRGYVDIWLVWVSLELCTNVILSSFELEIRHFFIRCWGGFLHFGRKTKKKIVCNFTGCVVSLEVKLTLPYCVWISPCHFMVDKA